MKKILLGTPPLVQPNTPYPATAVLAGFLKDKGVEAEQFDFSIALALRIFSRKGLERLSHFCRTSGESVRFFLDNLPWYLRTVEPVTAFLQGRDPAAAWRIARRGYLPEGPRFRELAPAGVGIDADENLQELFGDLGVADRAKHLASLYMDDIADALREGVDSGFGFGRYADHLAVSARNFEPLRQRLLAAPGPIDEMIDELADEVLQRIRPELLGIAIPFPGTLYAALRIARRAKTLSPDCTIVFGGGYINTELRHLEDPRIFEWIDALIFDEGYAPLLGLLGLGPRVRTLTKENIAEVSSVAQEASPSPVFVPPYYGGVDFSDYFDLLETANPMHRIWSDGKWLKMQLANGCYWRKCAFCDVALDCIGGYRAPKAEEIVEAMCRLKRETGQSGFHFTDEAIAPALAKRLSMAIIERGETFTWWGNVRFEKVYTPELASLMAQAGCIAVTGGLECAHDRLLKLMNKGITLASATSAMRAFSEAGILVHAYLMYGFPTETEEETLEALDFVRRRFADGSLQSAYWHRFALTTHSPIARNPWQFGLKILEETDKAPRFAENELAYSCNVDGGDLNRLGNGLRLALYNYMMGLGLDIPVRKWFAKRKR